MLVNHRLVSAASCVHQLLDRGPIASDNLIGMPKIQTDDDQNVKVKQATFINRFNKYWRKQPKQASRIC